MDNCPLCGSDGTPGFNSFYCNKTSCSNFIPPVGNPPSPRWALDDDEWAVPWLSCNLKRGDKVRISRYASLKHMNNLLAEVFQKSPGWHGRTTAGRATQEMWDLLVENDFQLTVDLIHHSTRGRAFVSEEGQGRSTGYGYTWSAVWVEQIEAADSRDSS